MISGDEGKAIGETHLLYKRDQGDFLRWLARNVASDANVLTRGAKLAAAMMNSQQAIKEFGARAYDAAIRISTNLGLSQAVKDNIMYLGERWDGKGSQSGVRGQFIPLGARIVNFATVAQLIQASDGAKAAQEIAQQERSKAFDPQVVDAFLEIGKTPEFWSNLEQESVLESVWSLEPQTSYSTISESRLDDVAIAFAEFIDLKSRFTGRHSRGVALVAEGLAKRIGLPSQEVTLTRRAGLLHDFGKVSVPNSILDKNGKLTEREWERMRLHPYYSERILSKVDVLKPLAPIAGAHHEWMNGNGYFRQLGAPQLSKPAHVMAIADMFQALSEERPYRPALETEQVLQIMSKEVGDHLCPDCFAALKAMI